MIRNYLIKVKSIYILLIALSIWTCDSDENITENSITFERGYFTVNKGSYTSTESYDSSIFFDYYDYSESFNFGQDIYSLVNNETINGYIKDFVVDEQFAYILVDNTANNEEDMLIVLNKHTFKIIKKIKNGIINPTKVVTYQEKAYIICGSVQLNNYTIQVINTQTGGFITSINVLNLNSNSLLLINNNKIYVNSTGSIGFQHNVYEIDVNSNNITNTFYTDISLNSMVFANNNIVVCGSNPNLDFSKVYSINVNSGIVSLNIQRDYRLIKNLSYSNGLFSLMIFDSLYASDYGIIYNWSGTGSVLTNPMEREIHGYYYSINMTSFTMRDRLIYFTYNDGRYILDIDENSFILQTSTGPNTNKVVFY